MLLRLYPQLVFFFLEVNVAFFLVRLVISGAGGLGEGDFLVIDLVVVDQVAGLFHHEPFRDGGNDKR